MTDQQIRPVDAIANAFVDDYAALDPLTATMAGVPGHEHELTDLSPDGFAARESLIRSALAAARAATPTDGREQVAKDAFVERLGLDVERYSALLPQSQVSVITSGLHDIRETFDLMDTDTPEAWENIDARLAAVPRTLAGYRETLLRAADAGEVSARRQLREVAGQVRHWTGQEGSSGSFFLGLAAGSGTSGALRSRLERNASAANDAFAELGRFLDGELAPRGREVEAVGRDRYALESRYFLGAAVDLEETYAWGWEELKRIEDEMSQVARQIVPGGGIDDAVAALDADPARRLEGKDRFRGWMQDLADAAIAELADVHFDIPQPVRRIECCLAPTSDGGIYYTGPSEDFHRPGRMW